MDKFQIITIVSGVLDGIVVLACALFAARIATKHIRLNVGRSLLAATIASVVLLTKALFIQEWSVVNLFGLMRLAYVDLVVVLPTVALLLLLIDGVVRVRRQRPMMTWPVRIASFAALLGPPIIGIDASCIEPNRLVMETATIHSPNDRALNGPIRIGVLADLQTDRIGLHERRAIDLLQSQRPDIIVVPGDVFQGTAEQFEVSLPALRELFGRLNAPGGIYIVRGNCDAPGRLEAIFEGLDHVQLLHNKTVTTIVRGNAVLVGGLADDDYGERAQAVVRELELAGESAAVRLLVAHRPDAIYLMSEQSNIDVLFAGHTHGGQVCVPFIGPLLTLTNVPRAVAAGGLHEMDGRRIYVSRGVGHERLDAPRIRFLCPPEVSIITLDRP